jgi:pimeloyl-ACP methyl ester carboxylesterase
MAVHLGLARRSNFALFLVLVLGPAMAAAGEPLRGYHKSVSVSAPTRLDWTFVLSNMSMVEPPADWLPDYDSKKQRYELFVPSSYQPKQSYPVIVFISPSAEPGGWRSFELPCRQLGIIFAAAYDAGNGCPSRKRVRIVLDVLDDVRRHYRTDPDRTYLAGFSGGARMACAVAFALPEHFGGVLPICAGGDLRSESWLRQRVIDRLSVAYVTGGTDFNRGEVERYRGPMTRDLGVRTRVWTYPSMGHDVPGGRSLLEVYRWLEDGLKQRQDQAKRYQAMRVAGDSAPSREEWSKAVLTEAKRRLEAKATLYSGLMQLKGCMVRWEGLPAADEAKKILLEYDARQDRPWEEDDRAEQRRFLIAKARALDAYASGPLPPQYLKMRGDMARQAISLWETILKDDPESKPGQEAKKRIPELQKLASDNGGKE